MERTQPTSRLQCKRPLQDLLQRSICPELSEERQRVREILDPGPLDLDNTLYLVEKEMERTLAQYQASASRLQKLQATFEFTASVARQEEKVRRKRRSWVRAAAARSWSTRWPGWREALPRCRALRPGRWQRAGWEGSPGEGPGEVSAAQGAPAMPSGPGL